MIVVADEFDRTAEQAAPSVDVFSPNVMGEPRRPAVARERTGQRPAIPDPDWRWRGGHVAPLQAPALARAARSCLSQAKATPPAPPCSRTMLAPPAAGSPRAQSRCHS